MNKTVKINIETFEQLLLPDSSGRSLKGLLGVVESWNKNRADDVLARMRRANQERRARKILTSAILLVLSASYLSCFITLTRIVGPINSNNFSFGSFFLMFLWFVAILISLGFCIYENTRELDTPDDLKDFEKLLDWLECKLGDFNDPQFNDKWDSFRNVQGASKDLAGSVMCRLGDAENLEASCDLPDQSCVSTVNTVRTEVFGALALLSSAGLISRDKSLYAPPKTNSAKPASDPDPDMRGKRMEKP